MPASKLTLQQQRERKQKILLAVLGVVLLAVLAFQLPKLLGGKSSAATADTTSTAAGVTTTSASGTSFASASVVAAVQTGGLSSFKRFTSKNPFKSQISTNSGSTSGASGTGAGSGPAKSKAKPPAPPVKFSVVPPATATDTGPLVPAVVLKLNGVRRVILVGSSFPLANPVFTLESVGKNAMWISLIGGSFDGGQKTLEIKRGHPLKLINATAKLTYVIRLVRLTTAHPPATTAAATTSATTTAATTTAPATTTGPTTTTP